MTFQEIILTLEKFWGEKGCIIQQPYDMEKGGNYESGYLYGAGSRALNSLCGTFARPTDGRYGNLTFSITTSTRLFCRHPTSN